MRKTKTYDNIRFPSSVIEEAYHLFIERNKKISKTPLYPPTINRAQIENETWDYDSIEDFLIDYPRSDSAHIYHVIPETNSAFTVNCQNHSISVSITFLNRGDIESIFQIFERYLEVNKIKVEIKTPLSISDLYEPIEEEVIEHKYRRPKTTLKCLTSSKFINRDPEPKKAYVLSIIDKSKTTLSLTEIIEKGPKFSHVTIRRYVKILEEQGVIARDPDTRKNSRVIR